MIPYRIWEDVIGYSCDDFISSIRDQCNSHFIFPDFEDKDRFPEKKFGQGKWKFDCKGNIIGKL
jgi:hypothetical protein